MSPLRLLSPALVGLGMLCTSLALVPDGYARQTEARYMRIRLQPTRYNPTDLGTAVLEPVGRNKTGVEIKVGRLPNFTVLPAHLYTYLYEGTCANRGVASYALNHVSTAMDLGLRPGMTGVSGTMPVDYEQVRSRPHAISVRLSPADGGQEIFCGDARAS